MEVAQTIIQLTAHKGVLEAEVARIASDMDFLASASSRYTGACQPTAFLDPISNLRLLRKKKERAITEIRQQLELFQLHHASGAALLTKLSKQQNCSIPVISAPVNVTVASDILSAGTML